MPSRREHRGEQHQIVGPLGQRGARVLDGDDLGGRRAASDRSWPSPPGAPPRRAARRACRARRAAADRASQARGGGSRRSQARQSRRRRPAARRGLADAGGLGGRGGSRGRRRRRVPGARVQRCWCESGGWVRRAGSRRARRSAPRAGDLPSRSSRGAGAPPSAARATTSRDESRSRGARGGAAAGRPRPIRSRGPRAHLIRHQVWPSIAERRSQLSSTLVNRMPIWEITTV